MQLDVHRLESWLILRKYTMLAMVAKANHNKILLEHSCFKQCVWILIDSDWCFHSTSCQMQFSNITLSHDDVYCTIFLAHISDFESSSFKELPFLQKIFKNF